MHEVLFRQFVGGYHWSCTSTYFSKYVSTLIGLGELFLNYLDSYFDFSNFLYSSNLNFWFERKNWNWGKKHVKPLKITNFWNDGKNLNWVLREKSRQNAENKQTFGLTFYFVTHIKGSSFNSFLLLNLDRYFC